MAWESYDGYRDRQAAVNAARDLRQSGVVTGVRVRHKRNDSLPYHVEVEKPMRYKNEHH